MACCGLPSLPGRAPFGGDILSHDFVEAALMLRGGWSVWLLPQAQTGGSYEEVPSNVVDFAARDRRWCQGNLQHLALWRTEGLAPLSRLHLVMGVFAYVSPLTWLVMLALSVGTIVHEALTPARYFGAELSLFPLWPVSKAEQQLGLFVVSMALLVLPKLGAMLLALARKEERAGFGGARGLVLSVSVELVFAMLLAPVMMLFHSSFVVGTVLRRAVGWSSQARSDRGLTLREAGARHGVHTLIGLVVTVALALLAPAFLPWLAPVLLGLVLAVPLSWASSRSDLGRWLRARGVLLTPEESAPPPVLASLVVLLEQHEREAQAAVVLEAAGGPALQVPPLVPAPMPAQDLAPGAWAWGRRAARARRLAT
jgi:membrane glycosyltransferase